MIKVRNCGFSQKLKHESKKVRKQNVHQIKFYVCSLKRSEIIPQLKSFFFKRVDLLKLNNKLFTGE